MTDSGPELTPHVLSSLRKMEFDKVVERVSKLTVTDLGRIRMLQTVPFLDSGAIRMELDRVSQMKELLIAEGGVPLEGTRDIVTALHRTAVENQTLSIQELLDIGSTLRASHAVHAFLLKRKTLYPDLAFFLSGLHVEKVVEFNIHQALDEQGFVKDTASKDLKQIRRDLVGAREALKTRLETILRAVTKQEFIQEEILTTRDGRMVIPVKVEHKSHVAGFIHSTSASGQTVYVEPAESLDLNNALTELQLAEKREIHKILAALTGQVREIREPLEESLHTLIDLDLLLAKAKYSIEVIGHPPGIMDRPGVKLLGARHPVLLQRHTREDVVPLDFEIGGPTTTVLITGPNAGGKTVTLKTVGLLTVCGMAGFHIPAAPESEIYPFRRFFVDIGDDQSLETDLSTFSSHLINMKETVEHSDEESLVLIDEIGAGTDPAEGGALAAAVLQKLTAQKTITVATTHDGFLKAFAHESAGMENASMEFDQSSLRPTYRFRRGIPGSSFAFELAARIGISPEILDVAKQNAGIEKARLETLIVDLERKSQSIVQELQAEKVEREKLATLIAEYEAKSQALKKDLAELKKKAVAEARDIVRTAKSTIEHSIKEIRESSANPEVIRTVRQNVQKLTEQLYEPAGHREVTETVTEVLAIGDKVRLRDGTQIGEIVQFHKDTALVVWGNAKMRVPTDHLVKHLGSQPPSYGSPRSDLPAIEAKNEIDLRGLMGDEAVNQVQTFIDNAFVTGLHRVDIIHGKGTGALRKRIAEYLKTCPHVKSFRLGEWNEGGTGVTVVEIF